MPVKTVFRKTTETFVSGAMTLPQRFFVTNEVFLKEQARIFSNHWLCLGHQNQIARPGEFFTHEVGEENLLLVRDQKNCLRGFYNLCRHRGTRLCPEKSGAVRDTIRCPYHAWTYALDGRLVGAPHMDDVKGFEKCDHGLHPVALDFWEGFIFVSLAEKPAPLKEVFAPLIDRFAHWNLPRLRSARRIEYEVRANWKLIFENYSECYHCPLVHPTLAKLSPYDSAENDLAEGPFLGGFMTIKRGSSLTTSGRSCALPVGEMDSENHNRVFYYSIFPNLLLSLHPDYVMVHQLWPKAPDRTLIYCDWLFHPDAFGRSDFRPEDAIEFWNMTNQQDWEVCELSQQGIQSRHYRPGPYSPRESIPAAWDREYLRALGESAATD